MPDHEQGAVDAAAESVTAFALKWDWLGYLGSEEKIRSVCRAAAIEAVEAAAPHIRAAERERIKTVGGVSACCGAEYHREPGAYGRWQCHACGSQCDLIGTIG